MSPINLKTHTASELQKPVHMTDLIYDTLKDLPKKTETIYSNPLHSVPCSNYDITTIELCFQVENKITLIVL